MLVPIPKKQEKLAMTEQLVADHVQLAVLELPITFRSIANIKLESTQGRQNPLD